MKQFSLSNLLLGLIMFSGVLQAQESAWLNFGFLVDEFNGGNSTLWSTVIFPDEDIILLYDDDDEAVRPSIHHVATVTSPSDTNYDFIDVTETSFLDSVSVAYIYDQSLSLAVDTVLVNVIKHSDDVGLLIVGDDNINFQNIYYDYLSNSFTGEQVVATYKIPLTSSEVTPANEFRYIDIYTGGITIAPGERIGATVSFIPGYDYDADDLISDKNSFSIISFEQNGAQTTPDFIGLNFNDSYVVNNSVLNNTDANGWNGEMIPCAAFPQPGLLTEDHSIWFYVTTETNFCAEESLFTEQTGNITDGSGDLDYGNDSNCSWTIDVENADLIYFEINAFNTSEEDILNIYQGLDDSVEESFILSGEISESSFGTIVGNSAFFNFISDESAVEAGFDMDYIAYKSNESTYCDDNIYTASNGVVIDGSQSNQYQNNTLCTYHIDIPDATQITLNISLVNIDEAGDNILLYSDETMDLLYTKITSDDVGENIVVNSSEVFIVFATNESLTGGGWVFNYSSDGTPTPFSIENVVVNDADCIDELGSFEVDIVGGTPPYFFSNSDGYNTIAVPPGTHDFIFSDSADNEILVTVTIEESEEFDVTIELVGDDLVATEGVSYQWFYGEMLLDSSTNQTLSPFADGDYTVFVNNEDGCTGSYTYEYNSIEDINVIDIEVTAVDCVTDLGSFTYVVTGGVPPYSISNIDGYTPDELPQGDHEFTVTDDLETTYNFIVSIPGTTPFEVTIIAFGDELLATAGETYQWSFETIDIVGAENQTYTPTETGTYAVAVTDENGCIAYASYEFEAPYTITVTVNNIQHPDCGETSGSFEYTVEGGVPPYTENFGSIIPEEVNPGTYNLSVTDDNGISDSFTVTINEPSIVDASLSFDGTTLSITTTATVINYEWQLNGTIINGADGASYTPTQNGEYTATIEDAGGCTATTKYNVTGLGVIEFSNLEVSLYPNPAQHWVTIEVPERFVENAFISVNDMKGKQMIRIPVENVKTQINMSTYPVGNYIMEYEFNKQKIYKKFVIK